MVGVPSPCYRILPMSNQACWMEGPEQTPHAAISCQCHRHFLKGRDARSTQVPCRQLLGVLKHSKARFLYGQYCMRHVRRGVSQLLCSGGVWQVSTVRTCACLKEQDGESAGDGKWGAPSPPTARENTHPHTHTYAQLHTNTSTPGRGPG